VKHVASVAGRELRSLFVSPVAYCVLSFFAIIAGFLFVAHVRAFDEWVMRYQQMQAIEQLSELNLNDHVIVLFFQSMTVVLLFAVPALTMGLFAAEKANGTQELLLTSPLTIWDIVLGKFLAAAIFVLLLCAMVGAFPLLLFAYGDPEPLRTLSGLIGLVLVGFTYVAIGVFASSLTRSQIVAFLLSFAVLFVLFLLPALAELDLAGSAGVGDLLRWLSTETHLEDLMKGLVDTQHLAYFAVMIAGFLVLTKASVESVRWR
jgi:ABC-2 type transport system permease protein